jgi:hypothetical protein
MVSKRQLFGEEMAKIRQKGGLSQHNLANKTRSTEAAEAAEAEAKAGDDVSAAVKLIIEAMPHLRSMTIEVDDGGEVSVSFKTREAGTPRADRSRARGARRGLQERPAPQRLVHVLRRLNPARPPGTPNNTER